jgi:arylsulfatase A-like enzyme/Tfp pilus assembly protein PilF
MFDREHAYAAHDIAGDRSIANKLLNIDCATRTVHWIRTLFSIEKMILERANPLVALTRTVALALVISNGVACRNAAPIGTYRDAPVVLISIDTLRADHLPAFGYRNGSTPDIDRLAADGIVVDELYSHTPLTLPAHASLMTGVLPTHHGVRDNAGFTLGSDVRTLASRFKTAGYATGAAISAYVLRHQTGIATGFDFFDDRIEIAGSGESLSDTQRDGRITVDALAAWIDRQPSSKIFAFLHLYEPHTPYTPPPSHQLANPYDGEIAYADELVGRLIAKLKSRGWFDNAIVALVSDHGEGLGDHGESEHGIFLYREALHVPGILRLPGGARRGARVAGSAGLVDVAATLLDLAGLDADGLDGQTMRSAIDGKAAPGHEVYAETLYPRLHFGWSDLTSVTRQTLHYIRAPRPELYDLSTDPGERQNLAASRASTAADLASWLAKASAGAKSADPEPIPADVSQRLKSLGYVGSSRVPASSTAANLTDPKDGIASFEAFKRALAIESAGRTAEAIQAYRSVLASNPKMIDAWEALAKALLARNQTGDAIAAFRSAIDVDPLKPEAHLALARIYALDRQPLLARQHAEIGSRRDPAQGYEILAELMMDAAKPDEAADFARRSLQADPSRYMSEFLLGVIAQERSKCAEAIPHFERAIAGMRLEPHAVVRSLHANLADCYARSGRAAEAEREFKAELTVIPDSPEAKRGLAALYKSQGRDAEASSLLQKK